MKATAFLTIATASSLPAPSAAAAAPAKASVAAMTEMSGFLNQLFTMNLRIGWRGRRLHDRTRQDCHKRANHRLKCLTVRQRCPAKRLGKMSNFERPAWQARQFRNESALAARCARAVHE